MKKILILASVVLLAVPAWIMADPGDNDFPMGCFRMEQDDFGGFGGGGHVLGRAGVGFHNRGFGVGDGAGMGIMMLLANQEEIGLTDEQVDKLKQMRQDFELAAIDRQADLKKAEVELAALLGDKDAAESSVFRQIDKVSGFKADIHKMRYSHHQAVKGLLTDEQVAKIKDMRKEMRDRFRENRKERGQQGMRGKRGGGRGL